MSTQWMAIQSFQSSQELLSALNTLSLHLKIKRAGKRDRQREAAVAQARERLDAFLQEMDQFVTREEEGDPRPLLGVDARFRQLVRSLVAARKVPQRFQSCLFRQGFSTARELLPVRQLTRTLTGPPQAALLYAFRRIGGSGPAFRYAK